MRRHLKLLALACALTLATLPATVLAANVGGAPDYQPEKPPHPTHPQHPVKPNASPGAKAKAYGRHCQGQSKKHVAGMKGTPFSQCVTAMAKLANGNTESAAKACAAESREHVEGMKGTPFALCVKAGKELLRESD
jgi:hypothetical protein